MGDERRNPVGSPSRQHWSPSRAREQASRQSGCVASRVVPEATAGRTACSRRVKIVIRRRIEDTKAQEKCGARRHIVDMEPGSVEKQARNESRRIWQFADYSLGLHVVDAAGSARASFPGASARASSRQSPHDRISTRSPTKVLVSDPGLNAP